MQELQKTIDAETSRREEAAARAATLAVTVGELTELVRNREQALDQKQAEVTKQPVVELSPRACKHLSTFLKSWHPNERRLLFPTPTKILSRSLREWLQGHFVAQTFQSSDQGSANSLHVDPIKVIRAEFPVVFLTLQHVISNLQQRMGYRHDRALGSPPSSNAPIQRREIVILHHRNGPGRLRQATAERDIALAHLAAQPFPGAFKTPGTQTSPGSQVPGRRKLVHVQSDLRQQSPGGHPVHSGNGAQPNDLIPKRAHAPIDLLLDLTPFRFREAQMVEELSEQKSMMFGHATFQCQFQFRDLVPQQPFGHLRQPGSVLLPSEHRLQDRSP